MHRERLLVLIGFIALLLVTTAPTHAGTQQATTVSFNLAQMNDSGSSGRATVTANADGSLHVRVSGSGFIPNTPHAQHLHGAAHNHSFFCPPASVDQNGDGQVATEEAEQQYGGISVSLTTKGDTSPGNGLALDSMPVANPEGDLAYERTIPADALSRSIVANLPHMHVVIHGVDINSSGTYDMGALGESVFAKRLGLDGVPEEATNPAACGEATPVGSVETGGDPGGGSVPPMAFLAAVMAAGAGALWVNRRSARVQ
jgi:hypothetical protein